MTFHYLKQFMIHIIGAIRNSHEGKTIQFELRVMSCSSFMENPVQFHIFPSLLVYIKGQYISDANFLVLI